MEDRTLLSAGSLDPTFGNLGRTVTDLTSVSGVASDVANAAVTQTDGKYLVAGSSSTIITQGILTRYNADGSLDPSFGAGGSIASSFFSSGFTDVAVLPDGSIVATGQVNDVFGNSYFGLLKVNSNGLLDPTFGVNGLALADFTPLSGGYSSELPHALTLQGPNIVVAGEGISTFGDKDMLIARFTSSGNLDPSFNSGSGVPGEQAVLFDLPFGTLDDIAYDVTIDNSNRILLAGSASHGDLDFAVARLSTNGGLDASFGGAGTGLKAIDFGHALNDEAFSIAVEPGATGNIIVGGYTINNANASEDFALTRLNGTTGAVLGGFGLVTTDFGTLNDLSNDRIKSLKVTGTQVVVAGFANSFTGVLPDQAFALARYAVSNGQIDPTLDANSGNGGTVRTAFFADAVASANALVVDSTGNYLVVGSSGGLGAITQNWALARYLTDGTLDTSFGNQARVLTDQSFWNGISNDHANSAITLSDGRIIVAGSSALLFGGTYGVLSRYLPNGQLDTTFGVGGEIASPYFSGGGFSDLAVLPDGSIVATGQVNDVFGNSYFGLLKVNSNGLLDPTFGINGLALADFSALGGSYNSELPHALALQGTNIVVAGEGISSFGDKDMLVARFTSSGNLDPSFNSGSGVPGEQAVLFDLPFGTLDDIAYDVTIDNSNRILLAGSASHGDLDFAVARLSTNGGLDASFGGAGTGLKAIDFGHALNDEAFSIAVEPGATGNIIVGGYTINNANASEDFALTRLNGTTGAVLGGFGLVTTDFGTLNEPSNDRIMGIHIQGSQVVVAGFAAPSTGVIVSQQFAAARYALSNGALDSTIAPDTGNGGLVTTDFFAASRSGANAITLDANNNWIVVGTTGDGLFADNIAVARYTDPPAPTITVSTSATTFSEAQGAIVITATLNVAQLTAVTIPLNFSGSALLDTDYTRTSAQIVIPAGQLTGTVTINGVADQVVEATENIVVGIGAITNATNVGPTQFTLNETDSNNAPPTDILLSNNTVSENQANTTVGNLTAVDAAVDTHTFVILPGEDGSLFTIAGNQLKVGAAGLNFETSHNGTVKVIVKATDQGNLTFTKTLTINVTDVNEVPTITAAQSFTLNENSSNSIVVGAVIASDPDGAATAFGTKTFSLTTNPQNAFAINATTGQITVASSNALDFETTPQFTLGVTVTDGGNPTLSVTQNVTINLQDLNEAPTIAAGQSFNLSENSANAAVVGTVVAADPDAPATAFGTKTYSLTTNPQNAFAINATTGQITVASSSALDFETTPQFTVGVTVTDGGNPALSVTQNVTVTLQDVNEAPTIAAGQSFSVNENSANSAVVGTVTASDPDGVATAFGTKTFSLTTNPQNAFAINAATGQITVANSSALNFETTPQFTVGVTVTDGGNPALSASQNVTVSLQDVNEAPTIAAGQSFSLSENSANSAVVGTVTASDPDGAATPFGAKTFSLTTNPQNAFAINATTGQITVANSAALNFETTPQFTVGVTVTDGGNPALSATQNVTVSLQDVNEAPTIATGQAFSLNENSANSAVVGTVTASDPDGVATAFGTKIFSLTTNPQNAFAINATTGQITVPSSSSLNFETTPQFTVGVTVTDGGNPALSAAQNVTVTLQDVNEAPTIAAGQSFSLNENSANSAVVGTVTASDPDGAATPFGTKTFSLATNPQNAFVINATTGQITVASSSALNFETTPQFTLGVTVTDHGNPALSATQNVTVSLQDVNEAPTIAAGQSFNLNENSPNSTVVGTVNAVDPDGAALAFGTKTFSLTANPQNAFAINPTTGQISVANGSALNFETTPQFTLGVTVTDGGNPALSATQNVTVTLQDVNEAPTIAAGQAFSLNENSLNSSAVGTVVAVDPDGAATPFGTKTFSLTSNPQNAFAINATTGQISVANGGALNFETTPQFTLGVTVTDGGNPTLSVTQNVTVTLQDVNEAPTIAAGQSFSLSENSPNATVVGTVVATDPDSAANAFGTKTFSLTSNPQNAFAINATTGQITVATSSALNFETTPQFTLGVTVTDGGNPAFSATQNVIVQLIDVNEAPLMADRSFSIPENSAANSAVGTLAATDPEGGSLSYSIVSGSPSNPFSINATTGQITVTSPKPVLDFETTPTFTLQVKATDTGNNSVTRTITINLTNVSEPPVIAGGSGTATFVKKQSSVQIMPGITVVDPEGSTDLGRVVISYSIAKGGLATDVRFANPSSLGTVVTSGATSFKKAAGTVTLTITLNDGVTDTDVQNFLRSFSFSSKKFDTAKKSLGRKIDVQVFNKAGTPSNLVTTQIRAVAKA